METKYGMWLPPDLSTHGAGIDSLIFWVHVVMVLLFVGWGIVYVYCLVKFSKKSNPVAQYVPIKGSYSKYVEIAVMVVEVIFLFALSYPIWAAYRTVPKDIKDPVVIRVIAQQFAWNVHYPGPDGKFGNSKPELVNEQTNPLGLDKEEEAGKDDITQINNLYIPVNRPVVIHLRSKDVIHSFFVPVLRVKQDAVPGMDIPIWFEATGTGKFDIACAQLCGLGHYKMRGELHIQTAEEYTKWLSTANQEETFEE